jgi:hypothetical protein
MWRISWRDRRLPSDSWPPNVARRRYAFTPCTHDAPAVPYEVATREPLGTQLLRHRLPAEHDGQGGCGKDRAVGADAPEGSSGRGDSAGGDRDYANGHLLPGPKERKCDSQAALKAAYQRLTKTGVNGVYYLRGADLLGDDNEGTVDSSHPTDLGFLRQADAFEKELPPLLRH